ncbi:MAG: hypothetical protein H6907_10360 [Hyphomicrobiales bacterium]|nr:hypothetical protein [Hyphomicrobiales bacterium]MCP5372122.1 hypothetical protein [Hyphomicrobiales bacterium]
MSDPDHTTESENKSAVLLAWAAAMPLALVATAPFWPWLVAAHQVSAPYLLLGHFLIATGGVLYRHRLPRAGAVAALAGCVLGVAVAVSAVASVADLGRAAGAAATLGDGARDFLYLLHGAYALGHGLVAALVLGVRPAPDGTVRYG